RRPGRPRGGSTPTSSAASSAPRRSEEHTSELQSHLNLVCRLLLEKSRKHQQPAKHSMALRTMPVELPVAGSPLYVPALVVFFLMIGRPPRPPLSPHTTLFG